MKILVTFALETEFAPWRSNHRFRIEKWGGITDTYVCEIGGAEVGVVLTGAGPKQASLRAAEVISRESDSINLCISAGLAGALKETYEIGQVLAAKSVFSDAAHADSPKILQSSEPLAAFAADCGATVVDQFYSAEHVVSRAEEKASLGRLADAVEMESYEILREASAFGIPAIAIRSISDLANEDLPLDMDGVFSAEGEVSIPRVLGQVALHPMAVPGLMKLGSQSKRAAESLARFLDRYVEVLASRMAPLANAKATAGE
jgi:nucleoside phosphorylase